MRESGCILLEHENSAWSEPVIDKKNRQLKIRPELNAGQPKPTRI